jgi:hypothetical protein
VIGEGRTSGRTIIVVLKPQIDRDPLISRILMVVLHNNLYVEGDSAHRRCVARAARVVVVVRPKPSQGVIHVDT